MKIRYTAELRRLILRVWEDAEAGRHAWLRQGCKWVTVEPEMDEGKLIAVVSLVTEVDSLGYPSGETITWETLREEDIQEIAAHTRIPRKSSRRAKVKKGA